MAEVASRELRNHTREVLERTERGETITVTVSGRPVARLTPMPRPTWVPRSTFLDLVLGAQADPGLARQLREMVPDTTDDL